MTDVEDATAAGASPPRALHRGRAESLYPCVGCHGRCCRLRVRVLAVEALRVALTLGVPLDGVVERVPYEPPAPTELDALPIMLEGKPWMLELHRPDVTNRCVFAVEVSGQVRCGIYTLRPALCRLFPYDVMDGERNIRTGSQDLCPVRWLKDAAAESRVAQTLEERAADFAREQQLLAAWEKREGPLDWGAFVTHASAMVIPWLGLDPRMFARRETPRPRRWGPALW